MSYADRDLFHRLSTTVNNQAVTAAASGAAMDELIEYLQELVDRKDADPGDGLLSRLVVHEYRGGEMTRTEDARVGRLLLAAGHETTANVIALGTVALLEHPEELAQMRQAAEICPAMAITVDG
ncbi:cytochrome P450 [Streptomyces sp. UG1]|uniref:cytochrome P450 n=1 Tax=Streptomyces sp. UG1 TaxID=3417652 RepID=UPI003CF2A8E1